MDAEKVMDMFSAAQKKAPNATLDYLSSKNGGTKKNQTVQYLDTLDKGRRGDILKRAVKLDKMQRKKQREKQADLRQEAQQQARVT